MPLATGMQCIAVITRLLQPGGVLLVDESAVQAATVKAEEADKARARKGASLAAVTALAAAPEAAPIVVDAAKAVKITLMKLVNKYARIKSVFLLFDFMTALVAFDDVAAVVVQSAEDGDHAAIGAR